METSEKEKTLYKSMNQQKLITALGHEYCKMRYHKINKLIIQVAFHDAYARFHQDKFYASEVSLALPLHTHPFGYTPVLLQG